MNTFDKVNMSEIELPADSRQNLNAQFPLLQIKIFDQTYESWSQNSRKLSLL